MIFIPLTVISLALAIEMAIRSSVLDNGWKFSIAFISSMISTFAGIGMVVTLTAGIGTYPQLISDKMYVETLHDGIAAIKDARYPVTQERPHIVAGSLDNMEQSQKLSDYIKDYNVEKSRYNQQLVKIKLCKEMPFYYWFGSSMYMDKRIAELEPIK